VPKITGESPRWLADVAENVAPVSGLGKRFPGSGRSDSTTMPLATGSFTPHKDDQAYLG